VPGGASRIRLEVCWLYFILAVDRNQNPCVRKPPAPLSAPFSENHIVIFYWEGERTIARQESLESKMPPSAVNHHAPILFLVTSRACGGARFFVTHTSTHHLWRYFYTASLSRTLYPVYFFQIN